jgi:hypothetical protein
LSHRPAVHSILASFLLLAGLAFAPEAHARDWFVRAGASGGDGSREKPFADPWQALERVEAHDKVHVATGTYTGKLEKGNWVIPFAGVQLLGGYDAGFTERNPWKHVTELTWKRGSVNRPDVSLARVSTGTQRDTSGATIDGFLLDMQDSYDYLAEGSIDAMSLQRNGAVDLAPGGVLRNCLIVNAVEAVRAAAGSVIENNVIVNSVRVAIAARGGGDSAPATVIRNNTLAFVWDPRAAGKGGSAGIGIDATHIATIEGNLVVHADNHGVSATKPAKVSFTGNAFWRNLFSNVSFYVDSKASALDDTDLDSDEDAGFAKAGGNVAVDPKLPFDTAWYERFLRRSAGLGKRFDEAKWAETRASAGLPPSTGTERLQLLAPPYPRQALAALVAPGNAELKQGARALPLKASFQSGGAAVASAKSYTKTSLEALAREPKAFDQRPVEVVAGLSGVTNASGLADISPDTHKGAYLIDAKGNGRTVAYFRKGTTVERTVDGTPNYGSGPPRDLFVIRGTARARDGFPKHALLIDSIEKYEEAGATAQRPVGRDWYVRAGESGGDGSREKPFRDPFQALEKAQPGDRILVAEGEYGGKLKNGKWKVDKQWLSLLGGYDRDFRVRDPWKTPSLLHWPADSKTQGQGYLLEGSGDHTGLVVDGFVFDRRTLNTYDAEGFLDPSKSDDSEHLWVFSPESVVRNCVFVNGAGGAARLSNAVTFENNIIANVWHQGIKVTGGFGTRTAVIRDNTILFVHSRRPHDSASATGSGIVIGGQVAARVEGNVIQYVDNFGIRAETRLSDVVMANNAFFRNWAAFRSTDSMPPPTVDEKSMHLLADLPFKRAENNRVVDGGFTVDPAFYASWFARVSALTSRFTAEEWQAIAPVAAAEAVKAGVRALPYKEAAQLAARDTQVQGARPRKLEN